MVIKFSKAEMQKAMKTVKKSVKNGTGQPSKIKMVDMNGKAHEMSKKQYCGLFDNQSKFYMDRGRYPNWVSYLYDANTPFTGRPQKFDFNCGSQSLSNASTQVLCYAHEVECRRACGTKKGSGTSPANLIAGAKKLGMKVERINRSFNGVKSEIAKGHSVIAHIQTGDDDLRCLKYKHDFGHWISIYDTTSDYKFKLFDPARTYVTCNANQIIKATQGRDIHFYSVKPL